MTKSSEAWTATSLKEHRYPTSHVRDVQDVSAPRCGSPTDQRRSLLAGRTCVLRARWAAAVSRSGPVREGRGRAQPPEAQCVAVVSPRSTDRFAAAKRHLPQGSGVRLPTGSPHALTRSATRALLSGWISGPPPHSGRL